MRHRWFEVVCAQAPWDMPRCTFDHAKNDGMIVPCGCGLRFFDCYVELSEQPTRCGLQLQVAWKGTALSAERHARARCVRRTNTLITARCTGRLTLIVRPNPEEETALNIPIPRHALSAIGHGVAARNRQLETSR